MSSPPAAPLHIVVFGDDEIIRTGVARLTAPYLRNVARSFGWALSGQRREALVAQMAAHYLDPEATARAAAALPADRQRLLGVVAWLGLDTLRNLAGGYERLQRALPNGAQELPPLHSGPAAMHAAGESGLLLGATGTEPQHAVPWPLAAAVPPPAWTPHTALPAGWRVEPPCDPVADLAAAALAVERLRRVALREPFGAQEVVWDGPWPVLSTEVEAPTSYFGGRERSLRIPPSEAGLDDAAQAEVARAIGDPDLEHGRFVVAELFALGMLDADPAGAVTANAGALDAWLAQPSALRLADALVTWPQLAYPMWDEYSGLMRADDGFQLRRGPDRWSAAPADFDLGLSDLRVDFLYGLVWLPRAAEAPDGGWVDGAALGRLVAAAWPQRFLPPASSERWYLTDEAGAVLRLTDDAGQRAAAALFAQMMRGPMRWLGLVETAVDPADAAGGAWAVRLSPLGRALITGATEQPASAPPARWDTGAQAVDVRLGAGGDAALGAARRFGAYAGPGAVAGSHRFRLGPDTLERAFASGEGPADIAAGFAAAGLALPPPVAEAVAGWWAGWGSVNAYHDLAVVEVADPHLAAIVRATTALDDVLVYQASPTAFVVPEEAVDGLLEALRRGGHTPRVTVGRQEDEAADDPASGAHMVAEDPSLAAAIAKTARAAVKRANRRGGPR